MFTLEPSSTSAYFHKSRFSRDSRENGEKLCRALIILNYISIHPIVRIHIRYGTTSKLQEWR